MNDIRERGIVDFRVFTDVHPEFVRQCMSEIRVLDINRETLDLFLAPDKQTLLKNLPNVFKDDMETNFREQLIDLWNGVYFQRREVVNYALDGTERHLLLQFSVLPGHEDDWSLVQVALADITARKKAEAYLEYLGKHDVLTKLHNRAFYVDVATNSQLCCLMWMSVVQTPSWKTFAGWSTSTISIIRSSKLSFRWAPLPVCKAKNWKQLRSGQTC